jgi:hypothetical protein
MSSLEGFGLLRRLGILGLLGLARSEWDSLSEFGDLVGLGPKGTRVSAHGVSGSIISLLGTLSRF